ncbi:hypothetical protein [Actinoplanes palleronii]|uniref:Uncharacterized protein n=1 Tax=Actinoplanes palleronii TaxID=113570 RepID=A0ABQ4BQS6_9ACTN|nr:hypothetical protein [Actinoplanes palleronii]GIE73034.1 hypothetical protein Apa02nite_091420 [Actinoplanes palleronii]
MADTDPFGQQAAHWAWWAPFCDADSAGYLDPEPAVQLLADMVDFRPPTPFP